MTEILFCISLGLPGWCRSKESACQRKINKRCEFNPWVGRIPWRRKWQSTPVFLPRESHEQRSLVGYSPWGRKRGGRDWVHTYLNANLRIETSRFGFYWNKSVEPNEWLVLSESLRFSPHKGRFFVSTWFWAVYLIKWEPGCQPTAEGQCSQLDGQGHLGPCPPGGSLGTVV